MKQNIAADESYFPRSSASISSNVGLPLEQAPKQGVETHPRGPLMVSHASNAHCSSCDRGFPRLLAR